jgi:hypothetical protein
VDDLEALAKLDFDALQSFRWLLARGPSRHVWPIVTVDAERYGQVLAWIPLFRTRIFGCKRHELVGSTTAVTVCQHWAILKCRISLHCARTVHGFVFAFPEDNPSCLVLEYFG